MAGRPKTRLKKQEAEKTTKQNCWFPGSLSFISGSTVGFIIGRATAIPTLGQLPDIVQHIQRLKTISLNLEQKVQQLDLGIFSTAQVQELIRNLGAELQTIQRTLARLVVIPTPPSAQQTEDYAKWVAPLITSYINVLQNIYKINRDEEKSQRRIWEDIRQRDTSPRASWNTSLLVIEYIIQRTAVETIFGTVLKVAYNSNNVERQVKCYNVLLLMGVLDFDNLKKLYMDYPDNTNSQGLLSVNVISNSWVDDYERLNKDPEYIDTIITKLETLLSTE
jgi:hypothetical protein